MQLADALTYAPGAICGVPSWLLPKEPCMIGLTVFLLIGCLGQELVSTSPKPTGFSDSMKKNHGGGRKNNTPQVWVHLLFLQTEPHDLFFKSRGCGLFFSEGESGPFV